MALTARAQSVSAVHFGLGTLSVLAVSVMKAILILIVPFLGLLHPDIYGVSAESESKGELIDEIMDIMQRFGLKNNFKGDG